MAFRPSYARMFGFASALNLIAAALAVWVAPAQAQVTTTCPTVNPTTGAVAPAPTVGVQWPGCDLANADLSGTNMSSGNLFGATLTNANLTGANLTGTGLGSADLTDANLTNAKLSQANLTSTVMTGATLAGVSSGFLVTDAGTMLPTDWILANNYLVGPDADLQFAGLTNADLTNADLTSANLTDAVLQGTTLTGAALAGATLTGLSSGGITGTPASLPANWTVHGGYLMGPAANLSNAGLVNLDLSGLTLTGVNLNGSSLSGTNLSNANLDDAILIGVNLNATQLSGASLTGEQSSGISGTPASLPTGWTTMGGFLIGPGADLHGADMHGLNLAGLDLSGANLNDANLVDANLTGANASGANLAGVELESAVLSGANLTKAKLDGANFGLADLTNAVLTSANLTNASLSDATITGASLKGAKLTGASGVAIVGSPTALPAHWSVLAGYLIGPGAGTPLTNAALNNLNLTGVDFSGDNLLLATFSHSNLTRAILTNANLAGVDFTNANLTKADLLGANVASAIFAGTTWNDTICPNGTNSNTLPHGRCFAPPPSTGFTVGPLPTLVGSRPNSVQAATVSCASATVCYGGGTFASSSAGKGNLPLLLHWTGGRWFAQQGPLPAGAASSNSAEITGMTCPAVSRCLAGGHYEGSGNQGMLVSFANGKWTAIKAPLPAGASPNPDAEVTATSCPSATSCFAVGQYDDTAGNMPGLLLRWSAGTWHAAAAPIPAGSQAIEALSALACPSTSLCFAGGWHQDGASMPALLMLMRSGGHWSVMNVPLPAGAAAEPQAQITGLSCPSVSLCVAVGFYTDSKGHQQGFLLTRSGTTWTATKAPLPGNAAKSPGVSLTTVSCPTTSQCTAGGGFTNTALEESGLLLFWSGKAWRAVAAPPSASELLALSCPTVKRCVAVGPQAALVGP